MLFGNGFLKPSHVSSFDIIQAWLKREFAPGKNLRLKFTNVVIGGKKDMPPTKHSTCEQHAASINRDPRTWWQGEEGRRHQARLCRKIMSRTAIASFWPQMTGPVRGTQQDVYGFLQVCFLAGLSCAMDPGGKGRTGGATKQCYVTISCEENHLVNT